MAPPHEIPAESAELVAALSDPGFYPHGPSAVELVETHISWVFLAGELAYKVKKPLLLPFLDYSTLERRRLMCWEELRLNRNLAPDYYRGVRAIVPEGGGYALAEEADPGAIEYAVEMVTIRHRRTLDRVVADGALEPGEIEAIGRRLARFHAGAEVPDDPAASVPHLLSALEENLETTRKRADGAIPPPRLGAAEQFTASYLDAGGRALLERRAAAGLVRDGHGDLRAEHVIVEQDEEIQVFDCVEFNPDLREIDVATDLSFLVMDLERLGEPEAAARLADAYREAGGDPGGGRLLAFLASYRAWVRAKVALFGPDGEAGDGRAAELHALGHRFAWRARGPLVLFVCGIAASGKSTLASALAEVSGLPMVDADRTRKRLAGLDPTDRAAPEFYSPAFSRRTYTEVGAAAARELERAGGVIVDATARRRVDRDAFFEGLGGAGVPVVFARCDAPPEVLLARARAREGDPERISDADAEVVAHQLGGFEPVDEVLAERRLLLDTGALELGRQVAAVEGLCDGLLRGADPGLPDRPSVKG